MIGTQSPENSKSITGNEKKLVKGVGYRTIYLSEKKKYELSKEETILRQTEINYGRPRETLYERVDSLAEIRTIEYMSQRWEEPETGNFYGYFVMEQLKASGKPTGCIKVVKRSKAIVVGNWSFHKKVKADRADWTYYKRRTIK